MYSLLLKSHPVLRMPSGVCILPFCLFLMWSIATLRDLVRYVFNRCRGQRVNEYVSMEVQTELSISYCVTAQSTYYKELYRVNENLRPRIPKTWPDDPQLVEHLQYLMEEREQDWKAALLHDQMMEQEWTDAFENGLENPNGCMRGFRLSRRDTRRMHEEYDMLLQEMQYAPL